MKIIDKAALRERQARSEHQDWVAAFCGFNSSGVPDSTRVIGMTNPPYHTTVRSPINLALSWHKSVIEAADCNHDIIAGKLSKTPKEQNPVKAWGPKDFF